MKLKPVQEQRDVSLNLDKIHTFLSESATNKSQLKDLSSKVRVLEEQLDDLHIPASVSTRTFNNTISRMREQFETELQSLIQFVNNEQSRVNQLQEDVYVDKRSTKILENYSNKIQKLRLDFETEFRDMRKQIEERQRQIEHSNLKLVETVDALRSDVETVNESMHSFNQKGTTLFNEVAIIRDNIDVKIKEFNAALEENAIRLEDYQNKQQPQFAAIFETVQSLETAILHIEQHPEISKIKDMSKNIMNLQKKVEKDIKEYNDYLLNKTLEIDEHIEDKIDHISGFIVELAEADEHLEKRLSRTENYKELMMNQQKVNEDLQAIRSELEAVNESLLLENRELRKSSEILTEDLKKALHAIQSVEVKSNEKIELLKEDFQASNDGPQYIKEYADRLEKLIKHEYNESQQQVINEINIQGEKPLLYKDFAKYINKLQSTIALLGGGGSGSIFDIDYVQPGVNPASLNDGDGLVWDSVNQQFTFLPVGTGGTYGVTRINAGTGIGVTNTGSVYSISNTGVVNIGVSTGLSVNNVGGNFELANTGITSVISGTGIAVTSNNGTITVDNTGITSVISGTGIAVTSNNGTITVDNIGVTDILAGTGISISSNGTVFTITNTGTGSTSGIGSTTILGILGFFGTPQTITESINLPTGYNWFGVGPVNVSTGATINVEGTSTLTIL